MKNKIIVWGIIGCGDVAEIKSGPAFQKCQNSRLLAVMRRDGKLAEDFATRHKIPLWYNDADLLLANTEINAVYIATPPNTHLEYAIKALEAGKHVYLEKPMVLSLKDALLLKKMVDDSGNKLVVAKYRRFLPMYLKVKELIDSNEIGKIKFVDLKFLQSFDFNNKANWRLDKKISGGGYFHDLAPHQIDLMLYFFGDYESAEGIAVNQSKIYEAEDMVNGIINFRNQIQFRGIWSFNIPKYLEDDSCKIYGEKGMIQFSFYKDKLILKSELHLKEFDFKNPVNIQQPMIQETVNYFLGKSNNPCSVEEGISVVSIMEKFTNKNN